MKQFIKKLDQDDILEILIEHFQEDEFKRCPYASATLFGSINKDLRFVAVFSKNQTSELDLKAIDERTDFNGDHHFLKKLLEDNTEDGGVS